MGRSVEVVSPLSTVADCPECRNAGSVIFGTCGVCFAEFFDEDDLQPWRDTSPLSWTRPRPGSNEHPAMAELFVPRGGTRQAPAPSTQGDPNP